MEWLISNFGVIFGIMMLAICVIWGVVKFFKMGRDKQVAQIKEWLIYACTIAEKELGSGTGQLKLRYVYDMFLSKVGWLKYVISFEKFSEMVDEALVTVNQILNKPKEY